ncbi:MAG: PAS domain S-box protein [Planctomycetota bacterium]|nr:MAG: PAS domain S-box protein [Planctomycetota bacterium]
MALVLIVVLLHGLVFLAGTWTLFGAAVPALHVIPIGIAGVYGSRRLVHLAGLAGMGLTLARIVPALPETGETFPLDRAVSLVVVFAGYFVSVRFLSRAGRRAAHASSSGGSFLAPGRETEGFLHSLVQTACDAVIVIDETGTVCLFNKAAERVFGHPAGKVMGRNVSMLMPPPYRDQHDGYIARYLEKGEGRAVQMTRDVIGLRADGNLVPLEISVSALPWGQRRFFVGLVRDVTEKKEMERTLQAYAARHERQSREFEVQHRELEQKAEPSASAATACARWTATGRLRSPASATRCAPP